MKWIGKGILGLMLGFGFTTGVQAQNNCKFISENQVECRVNNLNDRNADGYLDVDEWNETGVFENEEFRYNDSQNDILNERNRNLNNEEWDLNDIFNMDEYEPQDREFQYEGYDIDTRNRGLQTPDQNLDRNREINTPDQNINRNRGINTPDQNIDRNRGINTPDQNMDRNYNNNLRNQTSPQNSPF